MIEMCTFITRRHEVKVYQEWTSKVEEVSKTNLEKPLLIRNEETSQLTVNFDPEVCARTL